MDLIRCFLAIDPGENLRTQLGSLQGALATHFPFPALRWTQPRDYHLTLVFLGQVRPAEIVVIRQCVAGVAPELQPFRYRLVMACAFPDVHRPRVIAALPADPQPFRHWQQPLFCALAEAGLAPEHRPYRPHLSLGRWKSRASCPQQQGLGLGLEAEAVAVTLYESRGGHYQALFSSACTRGGAGG